MNRTDVSFEDHFGSDGLPRRPDHLGAGVGQLGDGSGLGSADQRRGKDQAGEKLSVDHLDTPYNYSFSGTAERMIELSSRHLNSGYVEVLPLKGCGASGTRASEAVV